MICFNVNICRSLAHGIKYQNFAYGLKSSELMTHKVRDLGVLLDSSREVSTQVEVVVKKANSTLGSI